MKDGNYRVHFSTPNGALGVGLVKVERGVIHGADPGFMYSGTTTDQGGHIHGQIHIQQHSPGHRSLFGSVQDCEIEFSGVSAQDSFNVSGNVVGQPTLRIGIIGWLQQ